MADSPTAKHRARLIREMSRELRRPSQSASNQDVADGSSVWDPENEAFSSTSFGDTTNTSQRLPTLRDSAKKYRTYTRPAEPEFDIDTSMMKKAFPDFSQGAIITEDGGSSLELGRAGNRAPTPASNTSGDYHLIGEQQRRPISASRKTASEGSEDLRKEAMARRASDSPKAQDTSYMSTSKIEDHGSDGSRNSSGRYRRPLVETQPRVRVDDDASQLSENISENLSLNVRRTRFGGRKNQQNNNTSDIATNEVNTGHDYRETDRDASITGHLKSTAATRTTSDNMSNTSMPRVFLFPDTRDLSSVLSLSQQNARPHVLPRQRKSRLSRFTSGEDSCNASDIQRVHTPVEDVAAQDDEQAIIEALNRLHERVATLESDKDSIRQTVAELKSENVMLRADMVGHNQRVPSNGTTGMVDGLVHTLQDRLDAVEGKATAAEATIKALTKERDAANWQLNLLTETSENLLDKIQLVEEQRDDFRRKLVALEKRYEQESQQWKSKQEPKDDIVPKSQSTIKRVGTLDLFDNSFRFVSGTTGPIRSTSDIRDSAAIQNALENPEEDYESECNNSTVLHHNVEEGNMLPQEVSIGQAEDKEPKALQPPTGVTIGVTQDLTKLSNVDTNNLVVLRKDLEEARIARPQQLSVNVEDCGQDNTVKSTVSVDAPSVPDASTKPSTRTSSDNSIIAKIQQPNQPSYHFNFIKREEILKKVAESKAKWAVSSKPSSGSYSTQPTEDSQLSSGTVIRRRPSEQLTSAFLIPDITFEKVPVPSAVEAPEPPKQAVLSPLVRQLVVSLSDHNSSSRSTCKHSLHPDGCYDCRIKRVDRASKATPVSINFKGTSPVKTGRTSRSSQTHINTHSSYDANKQPVQEAAHISLSEHEHQTHHDDHGPTHSSSYLPINNHTTYEAAQPQPANVTQPEVDSESGSEAQYEDQPTMRPSQHPGVALATVMKGLKSELRELKRELALRQKAYTRQDPTLGKRRRHQLREAIEALVRSAEAQADRIYALQDVLEGQKAAGQAMSSEELEETLQSIGIDCDVSSLSLGEN